MAVICVNTSSPEFKGLLEKTHFSVGTLKSIIHEYQNTPSLWEKGQGLWPSDDYVMNYFNRRFVGSPAQIAVWKGRFMTPHVYNTYQEAAAERQEASKWFDDIDITTYEDDNGNWVNQVARPIDVEETRKNSSKWLQDLQKDIDVTVNTGAYGRYIPKKNEPWKNVPAMNYLGKRLDNFYRQHGLRVKAYWSDNSKKWMVTYAKEERGYVDDINGGMFDWNEGQKQAIETISNFINDPKSGNYIRLVAKAGSGKTSIINAILEKVNTGAGKPTVIVGALSHKAKSVIEGKIDKKARQKFNIEARTIAGMLGMTMKHDNQGNEYFEVDKYARKMGIPIQSAKIVFIDEASMVSEEAMHFIDEMINWGTKVVFIGDNGQLPPIRSMQSPFYQKNPTLLDQNADSPVFTKEMPEVRLTERVRQGEDSPLHAVADLFWNYSQGVSKVAPDISKTPSSADNRLIIETGDADLVAQMLPLFKRGMDEQNPNVAKIVSFTNAVVNAFNARIHKELHPEMGDDMNFAKGDLITLYDSYSVGITPVAYNSEEGIVISAGNSYTSTFYTPSGKEVSFMVRNLDVKMADGRTVILPVLEQSAENITRYNAALNMAKAEHDADRWQSFYRIKNSVADLRFGYASTIHKSQGSTYEVVGVNTTDAFGLNKFRAQGIYTALTRASNISIIRGMNSQNVAPTAETITQANAEQISKRKGKKSIKDITTKGLTQEQIDHIHAETDEIATVIKQALKTVESYNIAGMTDISQPLNTVAPGTVLDATDVLRMVVTSSGSEQQKALAKALMPLFSKMKINVLFTELEDTTDDEGNIVKAPAGTAWEKRQDGGFDVRINLKSKKVRAIPAKTVLHELVHALTVNRLYNDAEFKRGVTELMDYVNNWLGERGVPEITYWGKVNKREYWLPRDTYGMYNPQEFLAEAMSNPYFQEVLKNIPAPEDSRLNTWQKLCKIIANTFSSLLHLNFGKRSSVYDMLIPVIADTMVVTSEQDDRNTPFTEWNLDRTEQMMSNAYEVVKAMNVAIEDKDVHWTTEQLMELFGDETNQIPQSYEGMITPEPNTIFVFGSNPKGIHGAGAAATAKTRFGAIQGQGEGLQGNAYALPTKDLDKARGTRWYRPGKKEETEVKEWYKTHDYSEVQNHPLNVERTITPQQIIESIKKLYEVANQNPDKQFKVSHYPFGQLSLNGYLGEEMLAMFKQAGPIPSNVVFNKEWIDHWNEVQRSIENQQFQTQSDNEIESIKQKAIANGTFMKAPNGNPTNLTEQQWLYVRTQEFKDWFGDWINDPANASKVVDENGEPLVMIHNSQTEGITEFKPGVSDAIFFADEVAQNYVEGFERGNYNYEVFLNIRSPYTESYEAAFIDEDEGIDGVLVTADTERGIGHAAIVKDAAQIKMVPSKQQLAQSSPSIGGNKIAPLPTITESEGWYPVRTKENITWSDVTLAFAIDDNSAGEKLTEGEAVRQQKYAWEYLPNGLDMTAIPRLARNTVIGMRNDQSYGHKGKALPTTNIKLNIAGNGIYTWLPKGITQEQLNNFVTEYIRELIRNGVSISEIRSGGQTGVDEAGIIAAQRLGIKCSVHAPKGYTMRGANNRDINDKQAFTARFENVAMQPTNISVAVSTDPLASSKDSINAQLKEYSRAIQTLQALVDSGIATKEDREKLYDYENRVDELTERLNQLNATEKPVANIVVEDTYELSPVETKKEGYSQGVVLRKKNMRATAKQGAEQIERLIEQGKLALGTHVMWQGLNASELAALNRVNGLNENEDGSWTVGYTEREIILKQQNDTLLKNTLFGNHELHKLAALTMFKLSETITQLQDGSVKIEDILFDESITDDIKGRDFKGVDRLEIIGAIGLDKLFKDVIREAVFNKNINTVLRKDRNLAKKAKTIYDNFDAFIRLGYQELIILENISIGYEFAKETEKEKDKKDKKNKLNGVNTDTMTDEDGNPLSDEEIIALFGSTVEHWQVGFRQVSTFKSLSKLMRQYLNRIYVLDKEGNRVTDEYGIEKNIDAHEAVSKILKWTQGATDIEDMISKLERKVAQEPWVQQLIDLLNADGNEQLRSQFFSNFKKYFQKYNIIYKEKTKDGGTVTRVKTINRDPFVLSTLDMISSLDNSKEMGSFNLWNPRTNSIDNAAVGSLKKGAEAIEAILNYKKGGQSMDEALREGKIKDIETAFNSLNIPMPTREVLLQALDSVNVLSGIMQALNGLHKEFMKVPTGKADYKFMNSKTQSNYTRIIEALAPVMGDGLESACYEDNKMHYSYVTPSYLSKFVENMKGMRGDVRAFIESEYGNIEGWFRNKRNNANQDGGQGWLNYWLNRMTSDLEKSKDIRAAFDHTSLLSDNGTGYTAKSPVQYMASMIGMYLYDDHGNWAWYRIPMMSNKPSEEYIKFERIKDGYRDIITDWLVNKTFAQEINRIRAVNFRNNAPAELEKLRAKKSLSAEEQERLAELEEYLKDGNPAKISSFDKNGAKFMFMEYLNQYVEDTNSELGALLRKKINGEKFDPATNESSRFTELLREAVQSNLDAGFDRFLRNLALEGLIQLSPDMKVIKVNTIQDKLPLGQAKERLEEFFWNDMFASINLMQLLCTDIAYYKNTEDLQKRFAQWHSPGLKGDIKATIKGQRVTDGNTRSMYIADKVEPSEIVETLKKVKEKVLAQDRFRNNAPAKALMAAQFDKVIDAFKEVNVTDAQAYTSPTGYRKKMAVFGQWTPRDEEVYQRILSGDFTAEDLDVMWQPLKPFVYSQIEKRGFNPYMPTLKMGVQQKNSEYCIILADALMRSAGVDSKLTAIFDFMEESHKQNPMKGIDTIMFNSAVKTGLMGTLDINDPNLSHDAVVNYLKDMSGMNQGEYDDRYVHTIPFEDYSIQQYNPAHFEGEQQMGSQNRVLVFADMPNEIDGKEQRIVVDGKEVSVKDAKIAYFKAIIDNIKRSGASITEEFDLSNKSKKMRNLAMMRVLQREIAKDSRYGTDLQWACLLDENGEFNIPLSDAIQSDRIQQLLNSIIKNRINKQEIAGGPVVQVSCYGYSEDLSIRFKDKNGNLLKSFKEYKKDMTKNWESDGHTEPLPEERVINQYKEYLRVNYASVAYYECYAPIYDESLLRDFGDGKGGIDMKKIEKANPKLLEMIGYRIPTEAKYSMAPLRIKGFLPKTGGEGIMLPKEITTLSGSDFDVDKMYIMRYQLDRSDNRREVIKEIEDEYKAAGRNGIASRVRPLINGEMQPRDAADHLILSSWRSKHKIEYKDFESGKFHNDNLIIATQWGILTAGMAEDQVLSSGNFDDVKHVGYMIAAMDNGTQYDSASKMNTGALKDAAYTNKYLQYADTQMQFHKQNMVAAKLIGVFAQANVSHAIVGMSDVPAEIQIPEGCGFTINGKNYIENNRYRVDQEYGLDNATRISAVLAQLLASSVDAVKDPVLNLLNINMDTVNVAVTLVRLGHDLEFIGMFLTHPIIRKLINRYNVEQASGSTNSLMQTLTAMQSELKGEDGKGATLQMQYNYDKGFFIREHTDWEAQSDAQRQYKKDMDLTVLELFKKINNMAEMFRGVIHTTRYNSITSAVGPYAADTMNNRLSDEQFAANPFVTEEMKQAAEGIVFDENGKAISIIQAFRDTSADIERQLLGDNMIQASEETYKVYKALKGRMGYMSAKMAKEFGRFYMSYYMNMETPLFDLSDSHREEMLDKFPKLFAGNKNKYRNNPFVQAVMLDKDKAGNDILAINTRGLTDTEIQALRSGWADLYTSEREKGIADEDNLAIKLVEYNFFLGSFGFSPKTFMSMTPNNVKLAIPGYKESLLRQLDMNADRINNILMQFMLNQGYANLGTVEEGKVNFKSGDLVADREFSAYGVKDAGIAKMKMKDGSTQWLYVEPISNSNDVRVYFVDKLGGENGQCFEIDPSRKVYEIQSVVKNSEPENASETQPDGGQSAEPMVDDGRSVYQHLMPLLAAIKGGYIMDNPKQNMANLQDRFNKLYNAGQQTFISSITGLNSAIIDKIADVMGVTQEELLSDVQESENKLNLCK